VREVQRNGDSQGQALRAFCDDLRAGLACANDHERQAVLRALVDRIEVDADGDRGELHGVLALRAQDPQLRSGHFRPAAVRLWLNASRTSWVEAAVRLA
jgi:hypothetical protein